MFVPSVCVKVLEGIDSLIAKEDKKNQDKIESAIGKYCDKTGIGGKEKKVVRTA